MLTIHSVSLWQQASVVVDGGIAGILGSIIGLERDRAGKNAGPRTMALVGATSAMITSAGAVLDMLDKTGDPTRTIQAIITGIGFLGAGLIFQSKRTGTQGVTTAATVFATAAMGCAVGLGFQVASAGFTLIVLIVLRSTQFISSTTRRNDEAIDDVGIEEIVTPQKSDKKNKNK